MVKGLKDFIGYNKTAGLVSILMLVVVVVLFGNLEPTVATRNIIFAADLDLSETIASNQATGYEVSGTTQPYSVQYPPLGTPGDPTATNNRKLTFNSNANNKAYRIIQSGTLATPADAARPKRATSIYNEIIIESGVNVILSLESIDLVGRIDLRGTANLTLLLDTDVTYSAPNNTGSFIDGNIHVPVDAQITIDDFAETGGLGGKLTVTASRENEAGIGSVNTRQVSGVVHGALGIIVIDGGTVTVNQDGRNGAAIGTGAGVQVGSSSTHTGHIYINGGIVNATVTNVNNAAIGGGYEQSTDITITGGIVNATSSTGAAIGSGYYCTTVPTITISGGTINATSRGGGAGIGGGSSTSSFPADVGRAIIIITGGDIAAQSMAGSGIGGGYFGESATITIAKEANILASSRGFKPAIDANGPNGGDGYYVNAQFDQVLNDIAVILKVYPHEDDTTLLKEFTLPANHRAFGYSTDGQMRVDNILVYRGVFLLGDALRMSDDSCEVYSVNNLTLYNPHNNNAADGVLPLRFPMPPSTIDLSETILNATSQGYTVNGTSRPYSEQYPPFGNPGGATNNNDRVLQFNNNANGKTFRIIQSGVLATPADVDEPKNGSSIFSRIVIQSGVDVTLILDSIDLIGDIEVQGTADLTLLLDNDTMFLGGNTGPDVIGSFVRGPITVSDDGSDIASLTIDDALNPGMGASDGKLTVKNSVERFASIGGGYLGGDAGTGAGYPAGILTFNGGTTTVLHTGEGTAAIGASIYVNGCDIIINGGVVNVFQNSATGPGAAIGGGNGWSVTPHHDRDLTITINGGVVNAINESFGAGIGSGSLNIQDVYITITGGTVTAQSGLSEAIGGDAGIPMFGLTATKMIHIDAAAEIWAYSAHSPAIGANTSGANTGDGYYVNAMLNEPIQSPVPIEVFVYAHGDKTTRLNTLTLPLNTHYSAAGAYRFFAYSTGLTTARIDNLYAHLGYNATLGRDDIRLIDRVLDDDKQIYSIKTNAGYDPVNPIVAADTGVLSVKLRSMPVAGVPSVGDVKKYEANLTSTGQVLRGNTFTDGGFYYSDALAGGRPDTPINLPWGITSFVTTPITRNTHSDAPVADTALVPNTKYYVATHLTAYIDMWLNHPEGDVTFDSASVVEFATNPSIVDGSAEPGTTSDQAKISARFEGGQEDLRVWVYWDTDPIDESDPASWATHNVTELTTADFDHTGFADFVISGLSTNEYNILIVSQNDSLLKDASNNPIRGHDTYLLRYACATDVTISKVVNGPFANRSMDWVFTITLVDTSGALLIGEAIDYRGGTLAGTGAAAPVNGSRTTDSWGQITLSLRHGQTLTLKSLSALGEIQVVEANDPLYDTSFEDSGNPGVQVPGGDTGLLKIGSGSRTFAFTNDRIHPVITGVDMGDWVLMTFIFSLMILGTGIAVVHGHRWRITWLNP
jgi:hypothetical protein